MKSLKSVFLITILASLSVASPMALAQIENIDDLEREITEDKIIAVEMSIKEDVVKEVEDKLQKATSLISLLGASINLRYSYSDEAKKEEAQYVHSGFIARYMGIREDQEALARKEIQPDLATLKNHARRLDSLINDLKTYLRQS